MKKSTYLLERDEEILIAEEQIDEQGNILSSKMIDGSYIELVVTEYNAQNLAVKTLSYENDILQNTVEINYDDSGSIVEQLLFFGEEVYERISTQKTTEGFIRRTYQEGEEVEVLIQKEENGGYKNEFYENGELTQYQISQKDPKKNIETIKAFDANDQLISVMIFQYDKHKRLLRHQVFSGDKHLLREEISEFSASLLSKFTLRDFENEAASYVQTYQYDQRKNLSKKESRSLTGNLIDFQTFAYDARSKCIEEVSLSVGGADPFSGSGPDGSQKHMIYRYES